ncbi:hypothetical protein VNO77_36429 [Canavalia gladiata]|uniref:CCT domain-containing protein n=1 Tax=Canavalia gladiata TaxID=3824 RepID=A0AAN9KB43_CANGL
MYTHPNTSFSRAADSFGNFQSPSVASPMQYSTTTPPPPQQHHYHQLALGEYDSLHESLSQLNSEVSSNTSSGCTSYVGSPSYETRRACLMQRSVSSHSLQKNNGVHHPFSPLFAELLDSETGPVRRACSTGDLQRFNGMQYYHQSDSPLSSESSLIIEGMSRTSPYSPEEKKVRIERYRSKRNQRNFSKKIKYACRKTLADSRPRIRGRFARNDEIVMNPPVQWSQISTGDEEEEEEENWTNFFDSLVPSSLAQEPQGSSSFGVFY